MAKLGQMVLDRGTWEGTRILSESWIDAMLAPRQQGMFHYSQPHGFLWWLLPEWERTTLNDELFAVWREAGVEEAFLKKIEPLKDKVYDKGDKDFFRDVAEVLGGKEHLDTWHDNTWRRGLPDTAVLRGPTVIYRADGFLGQYIVIVPASRLVAVRQLRSPPTADGIKSTDSFEDFTGMVLDLVKR